MDRRRFRAAVAGFAALLLAGPVLRAAGPPPQLEPGAVFTAPVASAGDRYGAAVEALLHTYEQRTGVRLEPGARGSAAVKVDTRGGRGLSTPLPLLKSVIAALERRGFERSRILVVDYSENALRDAGILPPLSARSRRFEGCPVIALENGAHFDEDWYYDSPLPPARRADPLLYTRAWSRRADENDPTRRSYLPAPLIFDVDFWLNLSMVSDDPVLGIDGVLANSTLWCISNNQRFLANRATASGAVAEIAAIPELAERRVLNFVALEAYQFIGGPFFNSYYVRSEDALWMSSDPVALDRLMLDRVNRSRRIHGFQEIESDLLQLVGAASLGVGVAELSRIRQVAAETP